MISLGLTFKVAKAWEKHLLNHIRVVLRIKQLKNGKGHNIKKITSVSSAAKFGSSATSIVRKMVYSLGLQFKEPKTCNIRLKNHIKVVLCKEAVTKKEHHIRKMWSVWKAATVAFFYKSHFSFLFCLFVLFYLSFTYLDSLQILTNWLFLALLKMVSFLEY